MVGRVTELRRLGDAFDQALVQTGRASCSPSWGARVSGSRGSSPSSSTSARRDARRSRPLPLLRRGHHLLAGGRGGQAADTQTRHEPVAATRSRALLARGAAGRPERPDRLGVPEAARGVATRRPWSSSSTTSVGRGKVPGPRSSMSQTYPVTHRSCCCAWPGPTCSTVAQAGPAASSTPPTCSSSRSARQRPRRWSADVGGLTEHARPRSCEAAEGNPLFVEEMAALVRDRATASHRAARRFRPCWPPASISWTPTSEGARARIGRGPHLPSRRGQALSTRKSCRCWQQLTSLVRKELVRPDKQNSQARTPSVSATY